MDDAAKVTEALKEAMSPQGVALAVAYLQGATCKHYSAASEVGWLVKVLTEAVGGPDAINALYEEIGV